jgi:hypothetical protein
LCLGGTDFTNTNAPDCILLDRKVELVSSFAGQISKFYSAKTISQLIIGLNRLFHEPLFAGLLENNPSGEITYPQPLRSKFRPTPRAFPEPWRRDLFSGVNLRRSVPGSTKSAKRDVILSDLEGEGIFAQSRAKKRLGKTIRGLNGRPHLWKWSTKPASRKLARLSPAGVDLWRQQRA